MKTHIISEYKTCQWPLRYHGDRKVALLKDCMNAIDEDMDADIYGTGEVIEDFENKMSELLGKEAAVFFPSGTMCQQIAIRVWCDQFRSKEVAYHPLCHMEIHEHHGLQELHGIKGVFLCPEDRVPTLADVKKLPENVKVILLELPQREIGGQLPSFDEIQAISTYCRERGIRTHLDGARLLEILPYYQKEAWEVCQLFDSVYLSFYKGLNGIAGSVLAGDQDFIEESKLWKRRYGGDLISLYPYILSADMSYELRKNSFESYYEHARLLAYRLNCCEGIHTVPKIPVSNMFHVYFEGSADKVIPMIDRLTHDTGVGLCPVILVKEDGRLWFEMSVGDLLPKVPDKVLDDYFLALNAGMKAL